MISIIVTLIKYMLILLMMIYISQCFSVFSKKKEKTERRVLRRRIALILLLATMAFTAMFLQTMEQKMLILYGVIVAYIIVVQILYRLIYRKASILLLNYVCMLISIGLMILIRLNIGLATKQMVLVIAATVMSMFVPVIVRKVKLLRDLTWVLSHRRHPPSDVCSGIGERFRWREAFGFPDAGKADLPVFRVCQNHICVLSGRIFRKTNLSFRDMVTATGVAAAHVLILAVSKDLGTALVFFAAYVVLIYIAVKKNALSVGCAGRRISGCSRILFCDVACACACAGMERPFCRLSEWWLPDRTGAFCHLCRRMVWSRLV
ncbi:MAG: hypothetical protein V8S26_05445 [Lachnospiraceae bacterium]